MTTKQTIDGVPRGRDALVVLIETFRDALHRGKQPTFSAGDLKFFITEFCELRALLDAPIPFAGYLPVPEDRKLPAVQYREVDGEHCQNPECCAWIDPNSECTQCKPAAQSQGEPVEPFGYWLQPKGLPMHGMFHRVTENDKVIYEPSNTLERFDAIALYAEQPAPVAVALPERVLGDDGVCTESHYASGWNACVDEVTRLNTK